ncbi:MAG: LptA/OstA family protein, partial [Thermodesulfobacteriota bacterium]
MNRREIRIGIVLLVTLLAAPLFAQEAPSPGAGKGAINITADRLVAQSRADYAEFTGNVHAVSDDFDIRADSLQVFYSQTPETAPLQPEKPRDETAGKTVREVIATGNVTILFGDKTATTPKAVYSRETSRVTLTGPGSTVTGPS